MKRVLILLPLLALLGVDGVFKDWGIRGTTTVGGLQPANLRQGQCWVVGDGSSAGDCITGGGTTPNICCSDGTNWVGVGDGSGAGSYSFNVVGDDDASSQELTDGQTLSIDGGEGIDTDTPGAPADTLNVACELASSANIGCASFDATDFTVTAGDVVISNVAGVTGADEDDLTDDTLSTLSDVAATSPVTRGDILIGSAVPEWDDLAIGVANTYLSSNGTDPSWAGVSALYDTSGTPDLTNPVIDVTDPNNVLYDFNDDGTVDAGMGQHPRSQQITNGWCEWSGPDASAAPTCYYDSSIGADPRNDEIQAFNDDVQVIKTALNTPQIITVYPPGRINVAFGDETEGSVLPISIPAGHVIRCDGTEFVENTGTVPTISSTITYNGTTTLTWSSGTDFTNVRRGDLVRVKTGGNDNMYIVTSRDSTTQLTVHKATVESGAFASVISVGKVFELEGADVDMDGHCWFLCLGDCVVAASEGYPDEDNDGLRTEPARFIHTDGNAGTYTGFHIRNMEHPHDCWWSAARNDLDTIGVSIYHKWHGQILNAGDVHQYSMYGADPNNPGDDADGAAFCIQGSANHITLDRSSGGMQKILQMTGGHQIEIDADQFGEPTFMAFDAPAGGHVTFRDLYQEQTLAAFEVDRAIASWTTTGATTGGCAVTGSCAAVCDADELAITTSVANGYDAVDQTVAIDGTGVAALNKNHRITEVCSTTIFRIKETGITAGGPAGTVFDAPPDMRDACFVNMVSAGGGLQGSTIVFDSHGFDFPDTYPRRFMCLDGTADDLQVHIPNIKFDDDLVSSGLGGLFDCTGTNTVVTGNVRCETLADCLPLDPDCTYVNFTLNGVPAGVVREEADCDARTDGRPNEVCCEDSGACYRCDTTDGVCNTAGEWDSMADAANITGTDADTNLAADLEEETHGSEHATGSAFLTAAGDILLYDYTTLLTDNPLWAAEDCLFTHDGGGGGAVICEGSAGGAGDAVEGLYVFPDVTGVDTTHNIATDISTTTFTNKTIANANNSIDLDAGVTLTGITSADVLIGTGAGTAAYAPLSGDATMTSGGVVTVIGLDTGAAFPGSPAVGDVFVVTDDSAVGACDSAAGSALTICRYNGATWDAIGDGGGGASLPVVDTTSIAEGSVDNTKEVRFEVDGNTTGIVGVIATQFTTAKTWTIPDATDTAVGKDTTDTLTNKTLAVASNNITSTAARCARFDGSGNLAAHTVDCSSSSGDISAVGDCVSGDCFDGVTNNGTQLIYEGATVDANQTALAFTGDPGGVFTVTIPNETGTIVTSATTLAGDVSGTTGATVVDDVQSATANTEAADNNTTQVATTAFVQQEHDDSAGSCTDQVVTAVNANAAPTCANVSAAMISDGVIDQPDIDDTDILTANDLVANSVWFATTGLLAEGATVNTFETLVTFTDPTADNTVTVPNASGTISLECAAGGNARVQSTCEDIATQTELEAQDACSEVTGCEPAGNGIVVRTAADTKAARTIQGTLAVAVVQGDGVAGDPQIDFNYTGTLAGNPGLGVDECVLSTDGTGGGIICEGSITAGEATVEGLIAWNPSTQDQTITVPDLGDAADTFAVLDEAQTFTNKTLAVASNNITSTASRCARFDGSGNLAAHSVDCSSSSGDIEAVGDCVTGSCFVDGQNHTLTFEGTTVNTIETFLSATDPTVGDQTYNLPNAGAATTDTLVALALTQTLTNKTLTTPTIGDFTNSTHDHSNNAGGGDVALGSASTGTTAAADDSDTSIATTAFVQQEHDDSAGSCTNQVVTAVNASAAPTCSNVSSAMISDGVVDQPDIDDTDTLTTNSLGANNVWFATTGILAEGATANTFETLVTFADPTADNTITFPDSGGTVSLGAHSTECSTSSCNLNTATTLNSQGICLNNGTNCGGSQPLSSNLTEFAALTAVDGDIIIGNVTPDWSKLAAGTADFYLTMGALRPEWGGLNLLDADNQGTTTQVLHGNAAGAVSFGEVVENDLAATLTFDDGDLLDFGTFISGATEGILLPKHATSCASATGEGQICWDADDDSPTGLWIGDGTTAQNIGAAGSGDITDVGPGYASGAAFTDTVSSGSGTTMLVWEGLTSDANQYNFLVESNEATGGVNLTFQNATGVVVTDSSNVNEVDGAGLAISTETLVLDTSEGSSIASGTAAPAADGALVIDTDGDGVNVLNDVLQFQSGAEDFLIPTVREYPTSDGFVLKFNATNDDFEWAADNDTGGATAIDALGDAGAGDDAVALAEQGQLWTWDTAAAAAAFDGLTLAINDDATSGSTAQRALVLERNATAGTQAMDNLLQINNNDTDGAVTSAIQITSAAGTIGTAIDLSDTDIDDAIHLGNNPIVSAGSINFDPDNDGTLEWQMNQSRIQGDVGDGPYIANEPASAINPVFATSNDVDTGMGWNASDQLSLIAGGVEILRLTENVAANEQITVGASTNFEFGANFFDMSAIAAPADPAAGISRCYSKTGSDGDICCRNSSSVETCMSAGGGGITWENVGDPGGNQTLTMDVDTTTMNWTTTADAALDAWTMTHTNTSGADATVQSLLVLQSLNNAAVGSLNRFVEIDHQDGGTADVGVLISETGAGTITAGVDVTGTVTTAFDGSDAGVTTALAIGANAITSTTTNIVDADLAIIDDSTITLTSEVTGTLPVENGGTEATSLTDGGILLGSGVAAITATAQPTNGQLLIGSTGVDPVLASLSAEGGGEITITPGAGSITLDVGADTLDQAELASAINLATTDQFGLPAQTGPTTDTTGEIAVDTTDVPSVGGRNQLVWRDDGETVSVPAVKFGCFVIEDLAAADDDYEIVTFPYAVTILAAYCTYSGTASLAATIDFQDGEGNAMTMTDATCADADSATRPTLQAITAGGALVAGESLSMNVTNAVAPETMEHRICFTYTVTPQ